MKKILIALLPGLLPLVVGACAWTPRPFPRYRNGLQRVRVDQAYIDLHGPHIDDQGNPIGPDRHISAYYDASTDTEYLLNNCEGAEAIPHEDAHRDGIQDPEKAGFN